MTSKIANKLVQIVSVLLATAPTSFAQPSNKSVTEDIPAADQKKSKLYIHIEHEPLSNFDILCSVFDSKASFLKSPTLNLQLKQTPGEYSSCQFEVTRGKRYAVSVVIDENMNGQLDTNLLGIPSEAIGTSNNPTSRFGPPSYEESSFVIEDEEARITIRASKVF